MPERITLTELQLIIKDSLYMAMPEFYWVIAEISEVKENSAGHCYIELIEKREDEDDIKSRIKAIIWGNRYRFLKPFFESSTGERLKEGMKILVKTKVEYHELYGLSLIISDIDPAFTLGEMALKKQKIIRKLEEEGIITMNKELEFPVFPQKIAVISSKNAAGYQDFLEHLKNNLPGYTYYTALFDSVMQGAETEQSIISSLDRIAECKVSFDVVVIIRGGGSQTDLSWFDNYNIAYYVTQFPVPVLTGIGHDKDLSVTDMVAYRALKTPTAVADFLVQCTGETEDKLNMLGNDIAEIIKSVIDQYSVQVNSFRSDLLPYSKILISGCRESLSGKIFEIINSGRRGISRAENIPSEQLARLKSLSKSISVNAEKSLDRLKSNLMYASTLMIEKKKTRTETMESSAAILDPQNVLGRGYSITIMDGKILKKAGLVTSGKIIETRLHDGKIKSKTL